MKFAIISDTHFGDSGCQLLPGLKYEAFKDALKDVAPLDYLVLAGDILDFSVASYEQAFATAQIFFRQAMADNLAAQFIYLSGNHDADIWQIMQFQRSVIKRFESAGKLPESFQHAVPAILDDRNGSPALGLTLHGVKPNPYDPKYGGMFLDKIASGAIFNFAFPNLYIVTDKECVLVTHGQYFEPYWALLGEVINNAAGKDMDLHDPLSMEDMVALNFPLNQLACTGIGQAGVLTEKLIRPVKKEIADHKYDRLNRYLLSVEDFLLHMWIGSKVGAWMTNKLFPHKCLMSQIRDTQSTRYRDDFLQDDNVKARFDRFFRTSVYEIGCINGSCNNISSPFSVDKWNLPIPSRVVFGHTHQPIAWDDPHPPPYHYTKGNIPKSISIHNTGGWLAEGGRFCGAEVFIYATGKGFSSISIN